MSDWNDVQTDFAAAFVGVLDIDGAVSPTIPAELRAKSAHVSPSDEDSFSTVGDNATFTRPTVSHELVIVAPAFDMPQRQAWLQEQIPVVAEFARTTDTRVAGRPFPKMLSARIGMIDQTKGLLGARCQFMPIQLRST
jgi:hypothetical protein